MGGGGETSSATGARGGGGKRAAANRKRRFALVFGPRRPLASAKPFSGRAYPYGVAPLRRACVIGPKNKPPPPKSIFTHVFPSLPFSPLGPTAF